MEVWKKIEGTDERYEVSNTGKVRSLNYKNTGRTKELRPAPDPKGYLKTMLPYSGKWKTVKIHRLVATAFIPNPDNKPQVNHINGNKRDNRVRNLEWVSNYDNAHHAIYHGMFAKSFLATQKENQKRKKPVIAIDKNGGHHEYESQSEASRQLNINRRHIQEALKGNRKTAGGYKFKYPQEGGDATCQRQSDPSPDKRNF